MSDINDIRNESCNGERRSATDIEQDSQSENSSDEDWIKLSPWISRTPGGDARKHSKSRHKFDKSFRKLHVKALKFLNSAYKKLAVEQHQLLSAHAESMRQRGLYKDHYPLVEQSLNDIVDFVMSCTEQPWDLAFAARLKELQSNFLQNKCRLLDQSSKLSETEDRLYSRQYRVTKQQAWFISCVQKLAYELAQGDGLDDFPAMDGSFEQHSQDLGLDQKPTNRKRQSQSVVDFDVRTSAGSLSAVPTIETAGLVEWLDSSHESSESNLDFDEMLGDNNLNLTSGETADSVWATNVWKILDAQLEQNSGRQAAKDCG